MSGEAKTPGQVLHEALCESAVAEFGMPIERFQTWGQVRESQRKRLESAAQAVLDNRTPWGDVDAVSIEMYRWHAVVRSGAADSPVVKVIDGSHDGGLRYYGSVEEWEAANT